MKGERYFLWLIVLLVAVHCFVAVEVSPEFYAPSASQMQELVSQVSEDSKGVMQRELSRARWSGENAQYLALSTLCIDVILLIIVGGLIVKCRRRRKDAA